MRVLTVTVAHPSVHGRPSSVTRRRLHRSAPIPPAPGLRAPGTRQPSPAGDSRGTLILRSPGSRVSALGRRGLGSLPPGSRLSGAGFSALGRRVLGSRAPGSRLSAPGLSALGRRALGSRAPGSRLSGAGLSALGLPAPGTGGCRRLSQRAMALHLPSTFVTSAASTNTATKCVTSVTPAPPPPLPPSTHHGFRNSGAPPESGSRS